METAKDFVNLSNFISQKQFDEHMKLYRGYVGKVNEITGNLAASKDREGANATYSPYRSLKKGETFALNGMILHELYFPLLGSQKMSPGPRMKAILDAHFGGIDNWKTDFTACGTAARGWAVLLYDQRTGSFRNILMDAHDQGYIAGAFPMVIMDMYEHAYFMDYGTDKSQYIRKFIESLRWDLIEKKAVSLHK
jgi:Fe-Mn family superoxide dismutase